MITGDRNPTATTLHEIAPVLGVTVAELVVGTDAAQRVAEANEVVARTDYEGAVRQVIEYERRATDLVTKVRDLESDLQRERERRQDSDRRLHAAEIETNRLRDERDAALRAALNNEADARRYRAALERAVADIRDPCRRCCRRVGLGGDVPASQ